MGAPIYKSPGNFSICKLYNVFGNSVFYIMLATIPVASFRVVPKKILSVLIRSIDA